ncbi:MAG TPA: V-type ATP synthase subunit E [Spirochaetales bacterium]|nr:V-type ATP synthase subunit E [Spirochaetales bacterium]HRY56321.1 V-type ATP synthase subunit E [Spirochaetia bacterium]HRZ66315.1 V-type ATP synthase subunit E [Spirochaetia bacterium]
MDIQLQELLDKIRSEGLDAAQKESSRIVGEAESKRAAILAEAEKEAKALRAKAEADAARAEESGKAALSQAARDLIIAFRDGIAGCLAAIVKAEVAAAYGPEVVAEALPHVLKAMAAGGDLELLLPPEQAKKLDARLLERLSAELKRGLSIRPFPGLDAGFRIAEKGGAAYYDFSAAELSELLARRLNPRLAEAVRSAAKGI